MQVRRILVPVDYSASSERALAYAAHLASRFGAELDAVHVWDRPTYVPDTMVVGKPGEPEKNLGELIRENADREMQEFLGRMKLPEGIRVTHHLCSGEPAAAAIKKAGEGYDLMVIGTHGRTGVRHLLLGSVAEKIVRLSPIPVITVPAHEG